CGRVRGLLARALSRDFAVVGSEGRSGLALSGRRAKSRVNWHRESRLELALFVDQRVRKEASCAEVRVDQRLLERCNDRAAAILAGKCIGPMRGWPTSDDTA